MASRPVWKDLLSLSSFEQRIIYVVRDHVKVASKGKKISRKNVEAMQSLRETLRMLASEIDHALPD